MPDAPDPHEAIRRFLGGWAPMTRAEALHVALQTLRNRVEPDRVLAMVCAELAALDGSVAGPAQQAQPLVREVD